MRTRKPDESQPMLISLVSAAIASGITYFLYGTEKGEHTRKQARDVALKARDKAMDMKDDVLAHSDALYSTAKDSYENMSKLFAEHRSTLQNLEREDMLWLAERFKERMTEVWDETREDLEEVLDDAKA
jgi:gas vesicle protein